MFNLARFSASPPAKIDSHLIRKHPAATVLVPWLRGACERAASGFWGIPRAREALRALALALALAAAPASALGREIRDATGAQVSVPDRPRRVVTLAPSLGELAADLSGGELSRIVGVTDYTDYPPALAKVASVGDYSRFSLEKVVALKPDLVLATLDGNPKDEVLHLRELGLAVVVVGTQDFGQVAESMRLAARALGVEAEGDRMAQAFEAGLKRIRAKSAALPKRRVLLQVGDDPLIVAGGRSFLNDALEAVGGANVYKDAENHYPRPSLEDVVKRDPDAIVVLALGHDLKPFREMAGRWGRFRSIAAVKARRVRVLQGDAVLRPTLRLLEGLSLLEKAVAP